MQTVLSRFAPLPRPQTIDDAAWARAGPALKPATPVTTPCASTNSVSMALGWAGSVGQTAARSDPLGDRKPRTEMVEPNARRLKPVVGR